MGLCQVDRWAEGRRLTIAIAVLSADRTLVLQHQTVGIELNSENWCSTTTVSSQPPVVTGISPYVVTAGSAFTLVVNGAHFLGDGTAAPGIKLQGSAIYAVTSYTDTQITLTIPASATQNITTATYVPVVVVTDVGSSTQPFDFVVVPQ